MSLLAEGSRVNQVGVTKMEHDEFKAAIESRMVAQEVVSANLDLMGSSKEYYTATSSSSHGVRGYVGIVEVHKPDMMNKIILIRDKIASLVDSSHVLSSFMHPQSIRETIKEMRHEIRECKKEGDITESDILSFMEEELNEEFDEQARFEPDVVLPF